MHQAARLSRRRIWPVLVPTALVTFAVLWAGLWLFAASKAQATIAGWREREAKAGRVYACDETTVGGFPLRIAVHCAEPVVELEREIPPIALKAADLEVIAKVYQPTTLTAEFKAPMAVGAPGKPAAYVANWTAGRVTVAGTPFAPERVSIAVEGPTIDRVAGDAHNTVLRAERIEINGRMAEGSAASNPVIEVVLRLASAAAPEVHALTAQPLDADIVALLHGLPDFAPKPWPVRLQELEARGGTIEITKARVQQGEAIAVTAGSLGLTAHGNLDGQLQVTIVGIAAVLKALDVDRLVSEGEIGAKIDSLDRIIPGLGRLARRNAAPGIVAGLAALGQSTTLEGKPAVTLPLRFADGQVSLGQLPIGRVPPLF